MEKLLLFIRLSRPHFLVGGALMYALGAGVSRYLGTPVNWGWFFLGHVWITLLQLSTHYLNEYFDAPADMRNRNRTLFLAEVAQLDQESYCARPLFTLGLFAWRSLLLQRYC
jgi:4-hydroxybenzoate polyprenyltransferase